MGTIQKLNADGANDRPPRRMSARTRFEVFKRDGFTCQYCSRKTPAVVLEVDHIIPVAAGGDSEASNLTTACWECNRGKGATLLDNRAPVPDIHDQTILMLEKEMQLREYSAVRQQIRVRENMDIEALTRFWDVLMHGSATRPYRSVLRNALQDFAVADIEDAMELAAERTDWRPLNAIRYLIGIIEKRRKERETEQSWAATTHGTHSHGMD